MGFWTREGADFLRLVRRVAEALERIAASLEKLAALKENDG